MAKHFLQCGDYLPTTRFKRFHDFLNHYEDGKLNAFEDRPVSSIYKIGNILSHEIIVGKHKDYYNFGDLEQIVDDFLNNVKSKFKPSGSAIIKWSKYNWKNPTSTSWIQCSYFDYSILDNGWLQDDVFNDFIFFSLTEDILNRVINFGMSRRSWRFNKTVFLNLKISNENSTLTIRDGSIYFQARVEDQEKYSSDELM